MSEPFRDKLGQLNKFYLPISKMIAEDYLKKKKTKVIGTLTIASLDLLIFWKSNKPSKKLKAVEVGPQILSPHKSQ